MAFGQKQEPTKPKQEGVYYFKDSKFEDTKGSFFGKIEGLSVNITPLPTGGVKLTYKDEKGEMVMLTAKDKSKTWDDGRTSISNVFVIDGSFWYGGFGEGQYGKYYKLKKGPVAPPKDAEGNYPKREANEGGAGSAGLSAPQGEPSGLREFPAKDAPAPRDTPKPKKYAGAQAPFKG